MTECGICYDDFDSNNIVHLWINNEKTKSKYCITCTNYMLNNNFEKYINDISKADCEKSLSNALSSPIPMNLTIDTLKKSTQIDYIENLDNKISAKLIKTITDDELIELNKELGLVLSRISEVMFDYLGEIQIILKKYNLI